MKCREPDFEENLALRNSPLGASVYTKMTTCKSYRSCTDCQVNIEFTSFIIFNFKIPYSNTDIIQNFYSLGRSCLWLV